MCGIAGYIPTASKNHFTSEEVEQRLSRMLEAIAHRGPDGRGIQIDPDTGVALGHVRLSIIDLSDDGKQPMCNEDGSVWITYNGEIYNYQGLREELIALGHIFASQTDTEVLVHGYEAWGLAGLLDRIRGMFAFAIYDKAKKNVHLARDPFGVKPLFYRRDDQGLVFGSELKAIAAFEGRPSIIARDGLVKSLHHMAVPSPDSIEVGVCQVLPAQSISFQLTDLKTCEAIHWSWNPLQWQKENTQHEVPAETNALPNSSPSVRGTLPVETRIWNAIVKSVERHLIADVPVGVFLSAGLDSSLIAAACAELGVKPTCLTVAIDDPQYDESPIAAELCKHYGFEHWVHRMGADECKKWNDQIGGIYDEPFTASAALSALEVCAVASTRFKVMLSGDGGDEIFGGYEWYAQWMEHYGESGQGLSALRGAVQKIRGWAGRNALPSDPVEGYAHLIGGFSSREITSLFAPGFKMPKASDAYAESWKAVREQSLTGFDQLQLMDINLFLPDVCLMKMDRASMHHSLEVRVPMLDRDLAELVGSIDRRVRNPNNELKGLLKRIARDKLPEVVLNKKKQGFSVKTRDWFPQEMVVADIQRDMRAGDWWQDIFNPHVDRGAQKLGGRKIWRFWQTWRWVKQQLENGARVETNS